MGRMQRVKGAKYERWVSKVFKPLFPSSKRGIGQTRSASEVPDVDIPGWWPECKHHIRPNILAALAQAIEASAKSGRTPIAICRSNRGMDTVTMLLPDFMSLMRKAVFADALDAKCNAPEEGVEVVEAAPPEEAKPLKLTRVG